MATKFNFRGLQIEEAVKKFEKTTGGELVIHVDQRAHDYPQVKFIAALIFGMLASLTVAVTSLLWISPVVLDPLLTSLFVLVCMCLGLLIGYLSGVAFPRLFMKSDTLDHYVIQRAESVFLEHELFATKKRIGILLHISLVEHKTVLMADSGINSKISDDSWSDIVDNLSKAIKKGDTDNGLIQAINQCAEVLLKNGFKGSNDDTNELPDVLIQNP